MLDAHLVEVGDRGVAPLDQRLLVASDDAFDRLQRPAPDRLGDAPEDGVASRDRDRRRAGDLHHVVVDGLVATLQFDAAPRASDVADIALKVMAQRLGLDEPLDPVLDT